jgi:hypothetical protein
VGAETQPVNREDDLLVDLMERTMRESFDIEPAVRHATREAFGGEA